MSVQEARAASPTQPVALRAEKTREDKPATKIQASWRGFSVRNFIGSLDEEERSGLGKTCSVCLDRITSFNLRDHSFVTTPCTHTYHIDCLKESLKGPAGSKCPDCRTDLSEEIFLNEKDRSLFNAIRVVDLESIQAAIAAGADVNAINIIGHTPLRFSFFRIQGLIEAGADITRHVNGMKLLIDAGANIHVGSMGETLLHHAARRGYVDVVKVLLDGGADINALTQFIRMTPLHWAVYEGHIDVVKVLIEAGANQTIQNGAAETPLDLAMEIKDYNCVWALFTPALFPKTFAGLSIAAGIGVSLYMKYLESLNESNGVVVSTI